MYLNSKKAVFAARVVIFGVCPIVTGIIYCRMYFTARHHANQMQVLQMQVAQNSHIESASRKRKSAISMFLCPRLFLVCYLPQYFARVAFLIQSPPSTALTGLSLYPFTLMFFNSSLNPVIYGWKMRHIRQPMINTLGNLFPRKNQANL